MGLLDIFRVGKFKKELEKEKAKNAQLTAASRKLQAQCKEIKKQLSTVERMEAYGLKKAVDKLAVHKKQIEDEIKTKKAAHEKKQVILSREITTLDDLIMQKKTEIIELDEEILLQSFGIYEPRYDLETSALYKARLDKIRDEQKKMVKDGTAAVGATTWTMNGSEAEGKRMIKDYVKLILRSFNNECDATIVKAKYNNVDSLEKKISKAAETLNKLGARMSISITSKYINLKLQELYLSYEYELKKQAEKEEQRRIKEQMREEAKVLKEIEAAKKKLQKEATHFTNAIETINSRIEKAETEEEKQQLEVEKLKVEKELEKVNENILTTEKREQNTRAGYVYVISNVGSFGENIYKIGMTRRLEPQERVDELGDASVPFRFDVHAMIFSEDAPALENALHRAFEHKRMNLINRRREFFSVSLDAIERVVRENFNKPIEITKLAEAMEYRQSLQIRSKETQTTELSYA